MTRSFMHGIVPAVRITEKRKNKLYQVIDTMVIDDYGSSTDDWATGWEDFDYIEDVEIVKVRLRHAIDFYISIPHTNPKEISVVNLRGAFFYITGGLTWPISPNDAYDFFSEINLQKNLCRLLEKWVTKDNNIMFIDPDGPFFKPESDAEINAKVYEVDFTQKKVKTY